MAEMFNHVAVVVSDIYTCLDFFINQLGFTQKGKVNVLEGEWADKLNGLKGVKAQHVTLVMGNTPTKIEMLSFLSPKSIPNDDEGQPNLNGIRHMGVVVEDLNATMEKLQKEGYKFISEPQQPPGFNVCTVYFYGPENLLIQLIQPIKQSQRRIFRRIRTPWSAYQKV